MQGVIGIRFGDVGLKDSIVESGLFGEGFTTQFMTGKHCNNAIRIQLYVAEEIMKNKK